MFKSHFWQLCGTTIIANYGNLEQYYLPFLAIKCNVFPIGEKVSLKLPKLANLCRYTVAIFGKLPEVAINHIAIFGNYLCCHIWQIAVNGSCRLWKLPLLAITYVAIFGRLP